MFFGMGYLCLWNVFRQQEFPRISPNSFQQKFLSNTEGKVSKDIIMGLFQVFDNFIPNNMFNSMKFNRTNNTKIRTTYVYFRS